VTTAAIGPGNHIMPALTINSIVARANVADNELGALCSAKHSPFPGCTVLVKHWRSTAHRER